MKSNYLLLTTSLLVSISTFAQKEELKEADKQLKKGNLAECQAALSQAEALIANAEDVEKAKFYFVKGGLSFELAKKKVDENTNLKNSAQAYVSLVETEKKIGKLKFTKEAEVTILALRSELVKSAVNDNQEKKYDDAAIKLYNSYELDKKDTIHLYYAASSAVTGQNYDTALTYYKELSKLGFTGKTTIYTALNKATNETENFGNSAVGRDLMVKQGTHSNPQTVKEPSKRGEIVKNIALIYNMKGDVENAKNSILDARKENPNDVGLIVTEANMYLESKQMDKYQALIKEALEKDPTNADLYYNLGVVSANAKNLVDAKTYYLKAIELNPVLENAYINLGTVMLDGEKEIVEKMNKLSLSAADSKKYEELKAKRQTIFKNTIPYFEKVLQINPENADAGLTLASIYSLLDQHDKAKVLKQKFKK